MTALVEGSPTDFVTLDIIGDWNGDPGSGWDVAGTANATKITPWYVSRTSSAEMQVTGPFSRHKPRRRWLCSKSTIGPISANTPSTVNATRAAKMEEVPTPTGLRTPAHATTTMPQLKTMVPVILSAAKRLDALILPP